MKIMKKDITKIVIKGKDINFSRAVLHVGNNNGITYMLTVFNPKGLNDFYQNDDISIVTREGEEEILLVHWEWEMNLKLYFI